MFVTASSLALPARLFSAWVMRSCMSRTTTLSSWKVEAVLGPRPRYRVWRPTRALVIAALSSPPVGVGDSRVMWYPYWRALGVKAGVPATAPLSRGT